VYSIRAILIPNSKQFSQCMLFKNRLYIKKNTVTKNSRGTSGTAIIPPRWATAIEADIA
jgi:hypothetical protein